MRFSRLGIGDGLSSVLPLLTAKYALAQNLLRSVTHTFHRSALI